ncbi:MAG: heme-binding protein [Acetobacteraceae bacterium]|nr:heme-binding protein [Acetobacteraceae bacterium]
MGAILYYLMTFAEAGLGAIGIRGLYEQPPYTVVEHLPGDVEVRDYGPRVAAETDDAGDGAAAFNRLFRYITGNNRTGALIEMTAPVSQAGNRIAMTVPVQSSAGPGVMRFFLPRDAVAQGPPAPRDPAVRLVTVPAERLAVLRFSGIPHRTIVDERKQQLLAALSRAGRGASGQPFLLTYDAPFTVPFLRRNEVAVAITSLPGAGHP